MDKSFCARVTYWRGRPFWMPVKKVQRGSAAAFCPCQRITHCPQWSEQPSMLYHRAKWKISGYLKTKTSQRLFLGNSGSFIKSAICWSERVYCQTDRQKLRRSCTCANKSYPYAIGPKLTQIKVALVRNEKLFILSTDAKMCLVCRGTVINSLLCT